MTPYKFLIFSICLFAMACKKEAGPDSIADKGILYDTANLGTKINIGGVSSVYWGRNSDEIFVRVGEPYGAKIINYQVDLLTKKYSVITLNEGAIIGRNYDNSSIIMKGKVDNVYGYYLYHFNTGKLSLLLANVEKMADHSVNLSGNAAFYANGSFTTLCPLNSASCTDWAPSNLYHFIDVNSKKIVPLPRYRFSSFSKTGKRTVLGADGFTYIFDNDKAMLVDSFKIWAGDVYFDDEAGVAKGLTGDNAGEVVIFNAKTGDVIQKFRPSGVGVVKWSVDGTKLYYSYSDGIFIGIYDLISKKETTFDAVRGAYGGDLFLSPDNKKILYWRPSREYLGMKDWYIKNVQ